MQKIPKLIKNGENEKVEFKENFNDSAIETLVAFTNCKGGKVFIGINDKKKITKEYIITGEPEREERWQYPLSAIREFVVNAVVHRDYRNGVHSQFKVFRNKLILWNIGKLPPDLTIEDLYSGEEKSNPRNLKIAEIFKETGLIEKYGSGIKKAVDEIVSFGLPKPKITQTSSGINIEVFGEKEVGQEKEIREKSSEKSSEKILKLIKDNPEISAEDVADHIGISSRAVEKNIAKLKKDGEIERIGPDKGGYWEIKKL